MKIFILICLAIASVELFSDDSTLVTGQLKDIYGNVPKIAHIQVNRAYALRPEDESFLVKPDGSFSFKLANGWYRIKGTAANMQGFPEYYTRMYCTGTPINASINLMPNTVPTDIDSISVLTSITSFMRNKAVTMIKQNDGIYTAEFKTDSAKFSYQILFHSKSNIDGRSFNGTMNDDFEYDGGGDYRSVVFPKNGQVKVTFDSKLMAAESKDTQAKPSFEFQDKQSKEVVRILKETDEDTKNYWKAFELNKKNLPHNYNFDSLRNNVKNEIEKEENLALKELKMLRYLSLKNWNNGTFEKDTKFNEIIISSIKPSSLLWGYDPRNFRSLVESLGDSKYDYIKQIYEQHNDKNVKSYMLIYLLMKAEKDKKDKEIEGLYNLLVKEYSGSVAAFEAERTLNPKRKIKVGNQVPNFSFNGIDELEGKFITSETLKGKWVLIDNWATWCGPCIGELPELHKVFDKFKDKNFTVLSVSFDAMDKQVSKFRKGKFKMPWLHAYSEGVWESEASKVFEVTGIPKPILIDPNGKIVALEGLRGEELEKTLESMIK